MSVGAAQLDHRDKFLILATDGVWEFMSSQEAVDCVRLEVDAESACERLTREAYALHCLSLYIPLYILCDSIMFFVRWMPVFGSR